jgi:stage II sporulation SpoAA-like protein
MLEVMSESAGNVLGIRARGALTNDDYQRVLVPRLESMLKHTNTIRVLFCMDETFQGWSAKAAWANTCLDVRHRRHFEKIAIVGAKTWEEWCVKLATSVCARNSLHNCNRWTSAVFHSESRWRVG